MIPAEERCKAKSSSSVKFDVLARARLGDERAFEEILASWTPYIRNSAWRYQQFSPDYDDLLQIGRTALWHVVMGFNPDRGQFDHYATRAIRNAMLHELRIASCTIEVRMKRENLNEGDDDDDDDEKRRPRHYPLSATSIEPSLHVRSWFRSLPPSSQDLLRLLYTYGTTQKDAGHRLGLSQPRISQLRKRLGVLAASEFHGNIESRWPGKGN